MASLTAVKCKQCQTMFDARTADVKRGWGKYCSKSCKAKRQEGKTGQYRAFQHRQDLSARDAGSDGFGGRLFYANFSNEDGSDQ